MPNEPNDEVRLPGIAEAGGSLYGVPQFGSAPIVAPSVGQLAQAVVPNAQPPAAPPSGMDVILEGMDPKQRAIFDMFYGSEKAQNAQRQAQAAAAAGAAQRKAADISSYLAEPRPPIYEPKYRPMPTPPKAQFRDPIEAVGSPIAGLAMIAGLFTRTAGTATLNAAAAAMKAQREGDMLGYETARAEFNDKLTETLNANQQERQAYLDSWNNRKLTMQEKLADLEMKATLYQNQAMAASARAGNVSDVQMKLNAFGNFKQFMDAYAPIAKNRNQWEAQQIQTLEEEIRKNNPTWTREQVIEETTKRARSFGLLPPPGGTTKAPTPGSKSAVIQANAEKLLANGEASDMAEALTMATERYVEVNKPLTTAEANIQAEMENLRVSNPGMAESQLRIRAKTNVDRGTKSVLSERDYNNLQQRAFITEQALDRTDRLISLLEDGEKAGLLGGVYRVYEVAKNIYGVNDTRSAQVQEAIQYLRQTYGAIMQTGSQRLKQEAQRIDYIIKGLDAGSTTLNTLQSIREYQEMLIESLKINQQQRIRARPDVPVQLPGRGAPSATAAPEQTTDFSAFPEVKK